MKHPRAPKSMALALCMGLATAAFSQNTKFTPPGTAKVPMGGKALFVDRDEVSNAAWAEYLHFLKNADGGGGAFQQALPDSAIWNTVYGGSILRLHGEFAEYPVVGITFGQAEAYCRWRTERVREKFGKAVTYRLPTEAEWRSVREREQHSPAGKGLQAASGGGGIGHLADNVSEMTAEQGRAMGANWSLLETGAAPEAEEVQHYAGPANWLGFRCVAELP